jgi:hypothetical protein
MQACLPGMAVSCSKGTRLHFLHSLHLQLQRFATPADHFSSALTEGTRPRALLLNPVCFVCAQRVRMIGGCPVAQGTFGRYNDLFLVDTGAGGVDVIFNKRGVRAFAPFGKWQPVRTGAETGSPVQSCRSMVFENLTSNDPSRPTQLHWRCAFLCGVMRDSEVGRALLSRGCLAAGGQVRPAQLAAPARQHAHQGGVQLSGPREQRSQGRSPCALWRLHACPYHLEGADHENGQLLLYTLI